MSWIKYAIVGGVAYIGGLLTMPVINLLTTRNDKRDIDERGDEKFHKLFEESVSVPRATLL